MTQAYFTTLDGSWFKPTEYSRGPWDADSCHAGPPTGLVVRSLERLETSQRLARITVEIHRPIPMAGFQVTAGVQRQGRSVTTAKALIVDNDKTYATAHAIYIRSHDPVEYATVAGAEPDFASSVPGTFPIESTRHGLPSIIDSLEVRYDRDGSQGTGGPTTIWIRSLPMLEEEEPSGFQRICPLADSGNGISYNEYLDTALFVNADLTLALHREPIGEWFCSRSRSHWQSDGIGLADSELFDTRGAVGRALQMLIISPA